MDYVMGLISIILINLVLSGDNALVIALASRNLSARQQKYAILIGGAGAILLRVVLTFAAIYLLQIPYLQIAGGFLLLWIALHLVLQENGREDIHPAGNWLEAVKTILVADIIMSLDNVVAIAGVANGDVSLLVAGLAISIPIIMWGSKLIHHLIERWPPVIILGAAFLGWTAGEMITGDQKLAFMVDVYPAAAKAIAAAFALLVFAVSAVAASRRQLR